MKKTLWTMAAALALVGCSETELLDTPQALEQNAIAFDTYVGDNAQTRAAVIDKGVLGVKGFGVNAYYTKTDDYATASANGTAEDFMQNTKVTFNPDKEAWTYSPVKYWPNNEGDKVSFFAYGPFANNGNANNIELDGTNINFTVNPEVKQQVDLVYNTNYAGTINQEKQAVNERIHFQFGHALARIAFTVEAAVDETTADNNLLDGNTRINVKKVALVGDAGYDEANLTGPFYTGGTLSLLDPGTADDGTPNSPWSNTTGTQPFVFNATDHFYHTVKDIDAETKDEIDVVQLTRFNASEPQRLLNDDSYLMIIPQENTEFKIHIEYDVISGGYENNGGGVYDESAIVNKITSTEVLTVNFEKGKAYNFNLVLGMTSVKFEVDEVTEWDEQTSQDEWLPENTNNANTYILNQTYNKEKNAFEIATAKDLQALSGAVKEGAEYTFDEDGNPVAVTTTRSATRSGETFSYASADYIQVANIDLTGIDWEPIGVKYAGEEEEPAYIPFSGTYDAQSLYSITYSLSGKDVSGIFNVVSAATIQGLTVNGTISESKAQYTGGIVGQIVEVEDEVELTVISNCHFTGSIEAEAEVFAVGGIVGDMSYGEIVACSNGAALSGKASLAAGIVGNISSEAKVYACYNYGNVETTLFDEYVTGNAAGIVGQLGGNDITLMACYNIGKVTASNGTASQIVSEIGALNTVENNCYPLGDGHFAYEENAECEQSNYAIGEGQIYTDWHNEASETTAMKVMNDALADIEGCEWKYVAGDESIRLKVEKKSPEAVDGN